MPCPNAADLALALSLSFGGSEIGIGLPVWLSPRDCGPPYGYYGPAPKYVYDHSTGATWTGNGWAYLPIGGYYPGPPAPVAAPPPGPPPPYVGPDRPWHGGQRPY